MQHPSEPRASASGGTPVIDLSHFNPPPDFARAKSAGIAAVIHKATEGATFLDPTYAARRPQAARAGLLWGAYHFGTADDPVAQAHFFLESVQPAPPILVLDYETNPSGLSMSIAQARTFVSTIQQLTGNWPGLYGGAWLKESLAETRDPVLANCWLWLSQFDPTAQIPSTWTAWTLWQFTDSATIPGIGRCDLSRFNGPDLAGFWTSGRPPSASAPEPPS